MAVLLILIGILLVLVIYDYQKGFALQLVASYDDSGGLEVVVNALKRLVRIQILIEKSKPVLYVYVLNKKLWRTSLLPRGRKQAGRPLWRSAYFHELQVESSYGLPDPFYTGFIHAGFNYIKTIAYGFHGLNEFLVFPDYLSNRQYLLIRVNAHISLGHTIINHFKRR